MNLQDCFEAHKNTAVLVPGGGDGNNGQCAQWGDVVLHDVYGFDYIYTPGAKDWWNNFDSFPQLANNFEKITDGSIKTGDFVIYDERIGSQYGHIDVASRDGSVHDFWAYDSNWGGNAFHDGNGFPVLHEVHHNDAYDNYIYGSIRLKTKETPMPNDGDITNMKRANTQVVDYQPPTGELDYFKAPEHGWHDLAYDTVAGMQAQIDARNQQIAALNNQVTDLKTQVPTSPSTPVTPTTSTPAQIQGSKLIEWLKRFLGVK